MDNQEQPVAWTEIAASAYRAYAASTKNKNFRGDPMPLFSELPDSIQVAWQAAVRQVFLFHPIPFRPNRGHTMNDQINPNHYKNLSAAAIEDLRKAKWHMDRLFYSDSLSYSDCLAGAIPLPISSSTATPADNTMNDQINPNHYKSLSAAAIEDLRKAKWHMDVLFYGDRLAEVADAIPDLPINEPTANPADKQPPSGYRMLGDAKYELRIEDDQYWSLSADNWRPLLRHQVFYANICNWPACRKIEVPPKQYREPTQADIANGQIECEYRDDNDEKWRSGFLFCILGNESFFCVNKELRSSGQWKQCRIEVAE